jgi:hypothetical protein
LVFASTNATATALSCDLTLQFSLYRKCYIKVCKLLSSSWLLQVRL